MDDDVCRTPNVLFEIESGRIVYDPENPQLQPAIPSHEREGQLLRCYVRVKGLDSLLGLPPAPKEDEILLPIWIGELARIYAHEEVFDVPPIDGGVV